MLGLLGGSHFFARAGEAASEFIPAAAPTPEVLAAEREAGRQLKAQLQAALDQHLPRLVIPPGIYRVTPDTPDQPHLMLKDISHFQLIADGVTMICETKNSALVLEHCDQVTIQGLTIDYDPLTMTQGTITAVSPNSLDFVINAGYDPPDYDGKGVPQIYVADAATREVKPGTNNYGSPRQIASLGGGTYRLITKSPRHDATAVGDLIKIPQKLNLRCPHGVRLEGCKAVTLRNVTIEAAPCFGFVSLWGGDIALDHVRVMPGPPPPGATEPRIFSSSADGLNFSDDTRGPSIRHCLVASNGDDGIAIYNIADQVLASEGGALILGLHEADPSRESYAVGDTLKFFLLKSRTIEERKIAAIEAGPPASAFAPALPKPGARRYPRTLKVTLDSSLAAAPADRVLNLRYVGRDFDISDNVLVNNASRGINLNQSYGSVVHNYVTHSFLPGIHMTEFLEEGGSGFQTSVAIKDNVVSDCNVGYPSRKSWQGSICIVGEDGPPGWAVGQSDISITGNEIDRPNGIGIQVDGGSKIVIADNVFGPLDRVGNARNGAPAILLDQVRGATLQGNILAGVGWDAPPSELKITPVCQDIAAEPLIGFPR